MKKVLGLDLGTTSIGWAMVNEAENENEKSSIVKLGVRVNPLTVDEQMNFEKGKSITTNADRTLKRSMRRNLQRYKLRRENLIEILKENGFISDETILSENGNRTTFETYHLRAKAATDKISLEEFARVLLMINKKRGYKSSRKAKGTEDGQLVDGMEIAKLLYDKHITPGKYCLSLLQVGKKYQPDFYRSDLQTEFDKIWAKQAEFYPDILTEELYEELLGKKRDAVYAICVKAFVWTEKHIEWDAEEARNVETETSHNIVGLKRKGNTAEQKKENLEWRVKGLSDKLQLEELVVVLQEINTKINGSSGYLGDISDRSKELYFNKQTVGQYQMAILAENPNASLRNMVFYRKDYEDEFNTIWETQAKFHKELTPELKQEMRDVIIFYQRRLKSQKGLISFCEFENRQIEVTIDGKKKLKTVGSRVIPRSSPLFQEFKIWQRLNDIEVSVKGCKVKKRKDDDSINMFAEQEDKLLIEGKRGLFEDEKTKLAAELSIKEKMSKAEILKLLFDNRKDLELNFREIQGDLTQAKLFEAYIKIIEYATGEIINTKQPAENIIKDVETTFIRLGVNIDILAFDSGKELDSQPMYKLWHLFYSFEGDNSNTGNEELVKKIKERYCFDEEYAKILANITFQDDYGSLSAKAIRKILPHLKDGNGYDVACCYAGYGSHSASSLTKKQIEDKVYKDKLDILPKNSLRNPVVEKILNQMINVINTIIDTYGKPDEIRVELARELKKNAKEREELSRAINATTKDYEGYHKELAQPPFNLQHISRNDIIRYRLWKELEPNGYKTLYSNTYIAAEQLFTGNFDIEHIIPQSRLFDDSFSNKTLEARSINIEKGNQTAYDFVKAKYGETGSENSLDKYVERIEHLFKDKKTKLRKLKMTEENIPEDFINRDLGNTQYITKYAKTMLGDLVKRVVSTTGSITDKLREDWQLIDIMKELNWNKYDKLGLTETFDDTDYQGNIHRICRIKDWTKRNDHRHHAMDALTVAFTKDALIRYFNNMNASLRANSKEFALKRLYVESGKVVPPMPLNEFRAEAKKQLENILISIKAKNKVTTWNVNTTKKNGATNKKAQQTPRGRLHNETIYGSQKQAVVKEETVNAKFNKAKILTVTKPEYREALLNRLQLCGNDPKKAFTGRNSLANNPIYIGRNYRDKLPEKVKTLTSETVYTIRKDISPDLKIDKVVDEGVRKILQDRLNEFDGDNKKAFSNLDENPIWLNKEKGISIKRVTIMGISKALPLHDKRDKDGHIIYNKDVVKQPVDFVNTGSNHHVAIYRVPVLDKSGNHVTDEQGNNKYELQENVVSFFEAVARRNNGDPIIDKTYRQSESWQFLFSMKQNEYFVFPRIEQNERVNEETGEITTEEVVTFNPKDIDLMNPDNYAAISPNLFRVQKFSHKNYVFRHHLETTVADFKANLKGVTWTDFRSSKGLDNIVKVRLNHIGQIVSVGEY